MGNKLFLGPLKFDGENSEIDIFSIFILQKTFGEYTERTAFERPLTSGVAYALKVPHSEREQFEKRHGWAIKKMETADQTLVQDYMVDRLDPAPIQDEYAPVVFSQETVSHIVSIDMMSGKVGQVRLMCFITILIFFL